MVLLLVCGLLFLLYAILVLYYGHCWKAVPEYAPAGNPFTTKVSVIIPARNEEKHISRLLQALQRQTYPADLFEVIVVDDHSTDRTAAIVRSFEKVKLISLKSDVINSYKKKAIETGIAAAQGDWIVTTDADCVPAVNWLSTLFDFAEDNKPVFIAAPVVMNHDSSVLQLFQAMDFMILQAITGAVVSRKQLTMCNGANIAYEKNVFNEVNGFAGIDHIASGDDMLLMHKIRKRYPERVMYLKAKEAIVATEPQPTWRSFFKQRIRWASKAGKYEDKRFTPVLLLVYLFNVSFVALFAAGFLYYQYWMYMAGLWALKTLAELPLFAAAARFFDKTSTLKWFFFFQPMHIVYTVLSGLLGQFGSYEWKGRRVK